MSCPTVSVFFFRNSSYAYVFFPLLSPIAIFLLFFFLSFSLFYDFCVVPFACSTSILSILGFLWCLFSFVCLVFIQKWLPLFLFYLPWVLPAPVSPSPSVWPHFPCLLSLVCGLPSWTCLMNFKKQSHIGLWYHFHLKGILLFYFLCFLISSFVWMVNICFFFLLLCFLTF